LFLVILSGWCQRMVESRIRRDGMARFLVIPKRRIVLVWV
jgi:hypothetical protein